ncbi:MAG TPA: SRPBCC domain-containing protein [Planctomycetota bacterium]|nr:SRPBCC domain-containing protein [Planctomycetota bacterium]
MTPSPRSFQIQLDIQAPRDAVWQALTEAESIARWFAPTAVCEPRAGGRLLWQWGQMHTWEQTIEVFAPGAHLRTRYDSVVDDGRGGKQPLFVDFHLEGGRGVTTLRLVHSGFGPEAAFDAEYDGISGGWPVELRSLRLYLERHRGCERMLAWSAHSTALAPEVAWQRLTGPGGLAAEGLPRLCEGDRFALDVPGAGPISGTTLYAPTSREFSGVAANLDDGWFRVHCEHWAGKTQVWLWLAVYSGPRSRVDAYQRAFDSLLRRLPAAGDRVAGAGA